jgi:hypothetical protein
MIQSFVAGSTRLIPKEEFERNHQNLTDVIIISKDYEEEKIVFDGLHYYRKSWAGNHLLNCVYIYVGNTLEEARAWEVKYQSWKHPFKKQS